MSQDKFDYSAYGHLNRNELSIQIHLWQGSKAEKKVVSVALEFTNISAREIHVESRLWFTRLKVFANGKQADYIGPMVSMGPPNQDDFETLRPGDKFATEPVKLNEYYKFPNDFTGTLMVTFEFSPQVPEAKATLSVR